MKGKKPPPTPNTCAKISEAKKSKKHSAETCAKIISEAMKGKK
jgi:hypothetical protein